MNKWRVSIDEAQMKLDDTNAEIKTQYLDEAKNSAKMAALLPLTAMENLQKKPEDSQKIWGSLEKGIEAPFYCACGCGRCRDH